MGLKEILNIREVAASKDCDKRKPNMLIVWIIIAAIAFLAFGSFTPTEKEESEIAEKSGSAEYEKEQEQRLARILKKINGAGDVTVYIKLDDGGETVTAKNEKSAVEEDGEHRTEESEINVVMSGKGSGLEPYVIKEKEPQVAGVLVVATGAADEAVRIKIYEAVKALYGMSPHRIQVTY